MLEKEAVEVLDVVYSEPFQPWSCRRRVCEFDAGRGAVWRFIGVCSSRYDRD